MSEQMFYGHGKLLLTGEYFILDGAKAIALPTKLGQRMRVKYRPTNKPILFWKSFDVEGNCWFEAQFELWHFNCLSENSDQQEVIILQKILRQARKQNIHFLRDELDVHVETSLEFPLSWGLGSSSTLIYNISQWAYVSPYELLQKTFGGSGYDIACAQSMGPISYQLKTNGPHWETLNFNPYFKNQLYFVHLNKKQNSREAINFYYQQADVDKTLIIKQLNDVFFKLQSAQALKEFEDALFEHENIITQALKMKRAYDLYFSDYWGAIKSLGAWGGDFVLATSDKSPEQTKEYFYNRGYRTVISFEELVLQNFEKLGELNNFVVQEAVDATTNL